MSTPPESVSPNENAAPNDPPHEVTSPIVGGDDPPVTEPTQVEVAAGAGSPSSTPSVSVAGKPKRSALTLILMLLVTLLLGVIIGLLLERMVLNPEPPIEYPDAHPQAAILYEQIRRDADDPTAIGDVDAPVVIAEWADFRCSFCGRFDLETLPAIQHYIDDGLVRVEWNDFPVFQEESIDLAVAAHAAGDQGLFREMSHALMEYQFVEGGSDFSNENLIAIAEGIGVPDIAVFTQSLENSDAVRAEIDAAHDHAMGLFGRGATPQFIVNAQHIGGFLDGDDMSIVIEQELQRHKDES